MARSFMIPPIIFTGEDALQEAKQNLAKLGKKAFIVTDKIMISLGNTNNVVSLLKELQIDLYIYDAINREPDDRMIEHGVKLYCEHACDFFIAIGGGSPIDSMKAIAMMAACNGCIKEQLHNTMDYDRDPMVAIPTTAGTGSEATQFTIITDTEHDIKMLLKGSKLIPDIAIVDPQFTITVPASVTAATGIDALCHAIEAFTSKKAQQMSDTFALSAIKRILENLKRCYDNPQDIRARTQMSIAALEAGIAFNNASVTIIHGMSRPIGALFHIPHGLSNAILLEECIHFIYEDTKERLAYIARYTNISKSENDDTASNAFLKKLHELLSDLQIPTLYDLKVDKDEYYKHIPKMASDAISSGSPANTMKVLSQEDLENIYKNLYE